MNAPQLRFRPEQLAPGESGVLVETTPQKAGWEYLSFAVRRLSRGENWAGDTGAQEAALVLLGGKVTLQVNGEKWQMGERQSPFDGLPEPLITIWEPKAYPILLSFLSQGYTCPRKALRNNDVHIIKAENADALINVNTLEELEKVKNILLEKSATV